MADAIVLSILLVALCGAIWLGYKLSKKQSELDQSKALVAAHQRFIWALTKTAENDKNLQDRLQEISLASSDADLNGMYAAATRIVSDRGS